MSLEFEEIEEPLSRLGSLIYLISSVIITILGAMGLPIINNIKTYGTTDLAIGYTLLFIFLLGIVLSLLGFLSFARPWLKFKINVFGGAVLALALYIIILMSIPTEKMNADIILSFNVFVWIGIGGLLAIFIAKRPNLGKESNKHIYQAYGAVMEFILAIFLLILGIYILTFDISSFAGNGTFPGGFETTYIKPSESIQVTYNAIRTSGVWLIIAAIIIMIASVVRNIISLRIAGGVIIVGIIIALIGINSFFLSWQSLDQLFKEKYPDEYAAQLALKTPTVVNFGIVLVLLLFIGLTMIFYASFQAEPLEKWRTQRNHKLAAAEVAIRDQKLQKAIVYLTEASKLSSKLGEEDRAVELLTRINSIKEKAIKLRKAEAAEKKKRELEKAKKKAEARTPKAAKEKATTEEGKKE
ncbi:MAG: hypothetical protein ACTSQP_13830 [Promethearchaeota archaeon]